MSETDTMSETDQFLRQAIFYPCSGKDGAPVKFVGKHFQSFFYADYSIDRDKFVGECESRGFLGYRVSRIQDLDVCSIFGSTWNEIGLEFQDTIKKVRFEWSPRLAFLIAVRFERLPEFPAEHGPQNFDLWFARCEAIATFRAVFVRRHIAPKCLAYIRSGIAFGGNFSDFPVELGRAVSDNPGGLPEFMLYDRMGGRPQCGDYLNLVENYSKVERWDYQTEGYGMSNLTLGKLKNGKGKQGTPEGCCAINPRSAREL